MDTKLLQKFGINNPNTPLITIAVQIVSDLALQLEKQIRIQKILSSGTDKEKAIIGPKIPVNLAKIAELQAGFREIIQQLSATPSAGNSFETTLNLGRINRLEQLMVGKNFSYGGIEAGVQRGLSASYFALTEGQIQQMEELARILGKFYEGQRYVIEQMLTQDDSLLPFISFGGTEDLSKIPSIARADIVISQSGELFICEFETSVSGSGECLGTRECFDEFLPLQEGEKPPMIGILQGYSEAIGECRKDEVAIFLPRKDDPYSTETRYLAKSLSEIRDDVVLCQDDDLKIRDDGIYYEGKRIRVICNRFSSKDKLADFEGLDLQIMSSYKSGQVDLLPPPGSAKDNKVWLAILQDKKYRDSWLKVMSDDELSFLQSLLPKTEIIQRDGDYRTRDKFLKKAIGAKGLQDVYDMNSPLVNTSDVILRAQNESSSGDGVWILQQRISGIQTGIVWRKIGQTKLSAEEMGARVEVFIFTRLGAIGDVLVTLRNNTVVSGSTDSVMIPACKNIS